MNHQRFSLPVKTLFLLFVLPILSCSTPESLFFGTVLPDINHPSDSLRIVALGDAGTGGLPGGGNQQLVADDLALRADPAGSSPVDFVLYLGDNFYEEGVSSVFDPLWNTAFADVYDFSRLPLFYAVAGNHDYLGNVLAQVDYSSLHTSWSMPALAYAVTYELSDGTIVHFIGIDTNILVNVGDDGQAHWDWLEQRLSEISGGNIVMFGHHPVYSAGYHGDTPVLVSRLQPLMSTHGVDLYMAGHDHNLEIRQAVDGVHHMVSGSGGKLRTVTAETESLYAASVPGAVIIELDASGVTLIPRESGVSDTGTDGTPVIWAWN
jgi:tartrate-resistant acid phosphatase type 5